MNTKRTPFIMSCAGAALLATFLSMPGDTHAEEEDTERSIVLREISVVGSRRPFRTEMDTPSAVDIISSEDFNNQGTTQVPELMRKLVPSYNVNTQPISDAATFIRPANLRGLASDQTLVLVNGKRRHRAAVISWLGNGVSEGAQGPDISVIPAIGLKRVEVLRDTASAQYGSDAIAGVINFVLKDRPEGGMIEAQWGQTYSGDGDEYRIAGNLGIPLGAEGFANISAQWHEMWPTVRSVQRDDAQGLIDHGNAAVRQPYAQVWGQPDVDDDYTVFLNSEVGVGEQSELYAFGNASERETEGGFFFRNPNTRSGVFIAKDDQGNYRLPLAQGCPGYDDPAGRIRVTDNNELFDSTAYPGCFFNERFPGGFTPKFSAEVSDASGVVGLRGELGSGLTYDASYSIGESEAEFTIRNTINASLGLTTPTRFSLGKYTQTEQTLSLDMTRPVEMASFASPLYAAFGVEWREEEFEVGAGEEASWVDGQIPGAGVGSNGFSGFSPVAAAGKWDRSNVAAYVEFEADVTDALTLAVMGRIEDHEDYDTTEDFKVGAIFRATDTVSLRGSVSTGFRVPTVGQENVANVTTAFIKDSQGRNQLTQRGTIPSKCPEAAAVGAERLDAEESVTYTAGLGLELGTVTVTVDAYNIEVDDRLGLSADKTLSAAQKAAIGRSGCFPATDVSNFRYFGNGFDTRTRGIDLVASFDVTDKLPLLQGGKTELSFVGNYNDTEVTSHDPEFIGEQRIKQLEDALPQLRFNVTLQHDKERWSGFARVNFFGSYEEFHADSADFFIEPDEEYTLDAEVSYRPADGFELSVGAENIFDNFPDRNEFAGVLGSKYPESSPMGFSGGFYYARARYHW